MREIIFTRINRNSLFFPYVLMMFAYKLQV